jgi:hypothetical protein
MRYFLVDMLVILLLPMVRTAGQEFVIPTTLTYADGHSLAFSDSGPGDTIWIQSGKRAELRIANFHGLPGHPFIFANLGGQVLVESDSNIGIGFNNCSFFMLEGQKGEGYSYGFNIARVTSNSGMGISAGNKSTDFEIVNCEISNAGFAGIMAKTDPVCDDPSTFRNGFTQYNTIIHDCYIHDVAGEGMYIGNSFYGGYYLKDCELAVLPSVLVGVKIYNNRIERTGYDGIQVSSAVKDCEIHHNILTDCSYRMISGQMTSLIIGGGTQAKCFNNKIFDSYATGILVFGKGGTEVFNNLIVRPGKRYLPDDQEEPESGIFLSDKTGDEKTFYGIYNNTIFQAKSDGIRIDNTVNFEVRIFNNAIIEPGAFNHYETDNTGRTGNDAYIYDTGNYGLYSSAGNYLANDASLPGFVNVSGNDFHLLSTSPLIDAGINLRLSGVTTDLDDHERPFGTPFDAGAYEYSTSQSAGGVSADPDFTVTSIRMTPGKTMAISLVSCRKMQVRIRVVDLLGKVICQQDDFKMNTGNNELIITPDAVGMVFLMIQSDRLSYARKFIFL